MTATNGNIQQIGAYELHSGVGENYYRAYLDGQLIAASNDREFVLMRIERDSRQRAANGS